MYTFRLFTRRAASATCAAIGAFSLFSCSSNDVAYDATGTFEATEITVSAQAAGEVKYLNIQEGQRVENASVLGQIDTEQLQLKRDEIHAGKKQAEATRRQMTASRQTLAANKEAVDSKVLDLQKQVAAVEQQISHARSERARFAELVSDGAAPQKQVDDYDNEILVLQRQLEATREQISSANESMRKQSEGMGAQMEGVDAQIEGAGANIEGMDSRSAQIADQIRKADIKAPARGTIIEKYVEPGEFVTVGKPLFKMADMENVFLRAYITSAQLKEVKVGTRVKVFADYGDGNRKDYEGTVTWISSKSEFTPKTILTDDERADLVYAVKVNVKNDGGIKIGMYGEVKFE